MDAERKREIITGADFSEASVLSQGKSGFGQLVAGLKQSMQALLRCTTDERARRCLGNVASCYEDLISYYDSIPFDEMDRDDEDFRFLFEYREKLIEAGKQIQSFLDRVEQNGLRASAEWDEYQSAISVTMELWDMMRRFRGEILRNVS